MGMIGVSELIVVGLIFGLVVGVPLAVFLVVRRRSR